MRSRTSTYRGFTLVEVLVVIIMILIVSVLALPTIISGMSHRQVGESARILQALLAGAPSAIRDNAPSGIRLLPDPQFNGIDASTGLLDSSQILAANRVIPIAPSRAYGGIGEYRAVPTTLNFPYPGDKGGNYPINVAVGSVLVLEESKSTTSWPTRRFPTHRPHGSGTFPGDKLQINNAGPWYTVVGPMTQLAALGNSELFVNVGAPGTQSPLAHLLQ